MSSSAKGAGDFDWCSYREDFVNNHAPNGVSARKYLSEQGLNVNTGRRHFAAISKLEGEGLSYPEIRKQLFDKPAKAAPKAGSKSGSKSGSSRGGSTKNTKADPQNTKPTRSKSAATKPSKNNNKAGASTEGKQSRSSTPAVKRSKTGTRLTSPQQQAFIDRSSDMQIGNGGRFAPGNTAGVRTGAYMDLVHADSDIVSTVLNSRLGDVSGLVKLSEIRYIQMERLLRDRIIDIEVKAAQGLLGVDHNNQPIEKDDLIREAYWGSSGVMTGLLATLTMAHTQASKAAVDNELKVARFEREQQDRQFLIELAEERRDNPDLTALDVVSRIEARGLTPSPILSAEALKEIEMMRPPVDTSGISDEELNAQVDAYMAKVKEQADGISSRRILLEELMAASKASIEAGSLDEEDFADGAYTGLEHFNEAVSEELDGIDDIEWSDEA